MLNPDLLQKVLEKHGLLIKKEKPTREKYRIALHRDPRIAKVQIMSMSRPLDIASIYVRLRIHEEVSHGFELNPTLQMAGKKRDPNILLEKKQELLKTRAAQALEPDAAIRKYSHCVIVGDPLIEPLGADLAIHLPMRIYRRMFPCFLGGLVSRLFLSIPIVVCIQVPKNLSPCVL